MLPRLGLPTDIVYKASCLPAMLDHQTPCSSRLVDGVVRGGLGGKRPSPLFVTQRIVALIICLVSVGLLWGGIVGGSGLDIGSSRRVATHKAVLISTVSFAGFLGCYSGATCASERWRGRDDWVNQAIAGAVTGVLIGLPTRRPHTILIASVGTSLVTGASSFLGGLS